MALLKKSHGVVASCLPAKVRREFGLEEPAGTPVNRNVGRGGTSKK